jgi:hypothetical protein
MNVCVFKLSAVRREKRGEQAQRVGAARRRRTPFAQMNF